MAIAKWYKFDFHTHSPASNCFRDKSVDANQWIEAAKNAGLNGVVLTDHNSVDFIRKIEEKKAEYEKDGTFKIFYGIELCVSADLTHMLIIFDDTMSVTEIEDAVIGDLDLPRSYWGDTTHSVSESRLKILYQNLGDRIFVIPAHFASNKGLNETNINSIKQYMEFMRFSAVEVRNLDDVNAYRIRLNQNAINECALITGSDNPDDRREGVHSINGFGKQFTWVKMSELTFEGIRQALIDPEHRCINWLQLEEIGLDYNPNNIRYNYISGVNLYGFAHAPELRMRFSPNLNCIVGGRGTGKSTIVQALDYGLAHEIDLSKNGLINKTLDKNNGKIQAYYSIGEKAYKITANRKNKILEYEYEDESGVIENPPKFKIDYYGQKEIFDLLNDDNATTDSDSSPLIDMIDRMMSEELYEINDRINSSLSTLISKSEQHKNNQKRLEDRASIVSETEKQEAIISSFKASGFEIARKNYEEISTKTKKVTGINKNAEKYFSDERGVVNQRITEIDEYLTELNSDPTKNTLAINCLLEIKNIYLSLDLEFEKALNEVDRLDVAYSSSLDYQEEDNCKTQLNTILSSIKNTGDDNIKELQDKLLLNKERIKELDSILKEQQALEDEIRAEIDNFIELRKNLSLKRENQIGKLELDGVNISIVPMGHAIRYKLNLQRELGKESTYDDEFRELSVKILDPIDNYKNYRDFLYNLLVINDGDISNLFSGNARFVQFWKERARNGTLNILTRVVPEDLLVIKINEGASSIDISDGSPGQKCAALLTVILNSGNDPLIIDQPEDDLDNSLIYSLIVKSIRKMKSKRQIIIVTHNPNIPVLGDAEAILILERDKNGKVAFRKNKKAGCIEENSIKEGICAVMEGGEDAFIKREQKYFHTYDRSN